jgi:hypothetical protein
MDKENIESIIFRCREQQNMYSLSEKEFYDLIELAYEGIEFEKFKESRSDLNGLANWSHLVKMGQWAIDHGIPALKFYAEIFPMPMEVIADNKEDKKFEKISTELLNLFHTELFNLYHTTAKDALKEAPSDGS